MADIVSLEKRSQMMAGIKGINTKPERLIRSLLHKSGFRFRLHQKKLPGRPDLVFFKYKAVIFVHGCFWHGHNCALFKIPSSNTKFWLDKIAGNKERDIKDVSNLNTSGWRVMTVWECAIRGKGKLSTHELCKTCTEWLIHGESIFEIRGL
jgi:DNA mismatch endonuclease, patch repair protein